MKLLSLHALIAILPASLMAAEQIKVETKFIEVATKDPIPHDLAKLNQMTGVDLLSAPSVTTKPGQSAQVEITHDFVPVSVTPAAFFPVPTGTTIRVTPDLKDGHIVYMAQLTHREISTSGNQDGQTLTGVVSHDFYLSGSPKDDEAVWIDFDETQYGKKLVVWLRFTRMAVE